MKSTRRETDETKEDVEGRGREREEGRNVDGVGSVTAGARLGRAAEVAARRSADDDFRVGADQRVRRVAVFQRVDEPGATVAAHARAVVDVVSFVHAVAAAVVAVVAVVAPDVATILLALLAALGAPVPRLRGRLALATTIGALGAVLR